MIERIRPNKTPKPVPAPYVPAKKQKRQIPDLELRTSFNLEGYGAPVKAAPNLQVKLSCRTKITPGAETRVYYAGGVLLGGAVFSPAGIVAKFHHDREPALTKYETENQLLAALVAMLAGEP